jgi:hypothetical protein
MRPAACIVGFVSFVAFLLALAIGSLPFLDLVQLCHVKVTDLESLHILPVLCCVFGGLLLFSVLGCCVARTGMKRFKLPLILFMLVLAVGSALGAVYLQGLYPVATRVHKVIDDVQSRGMQEIFHDFTVLYAAGDCRTQELIELPKWAATTCAECSIMESALASCTEPEPDALQKCMLTYAGTVSGCDAACTHAFCKCMEDARADAKTGAGAIANGLVVAGITFVLLAILACMVERRNRRTVEVYEITEQMLPAQPTEVVRPRQPTLA